jgi:DNA replication factor GINS
MNIDELRSAQSKERQKSDLQQLRESFYGDVAEYVEELESERERAAERAEDPFGSPEVQQLTNDIETAKDTAEAIYERRLGKIVKKASLVSAEMANQNDVSGLTTEEQALFADLREYGDGRCVAVGIDRERRRPPPRGGPAGRWRRRTSGGSRG